MGIKGRPSTLCWAILVWLGLSITADVLIAWSLCYILNKSRTGFARTDWMIKRLTVFFVQTGLIMSFVAVVTVAIWTVAKLDTDHLMMSFPMGGIYATCLMANLIARESYFHPRVAYEDTELPTILRGSMVVAAPRNFDKISPELLHERSSQTHTSITFSNDGSATAVEL
ncbi:hypothetical protein BS17DRAFT_109116 [Gyrodon lividus]|nr:hypothetical protein BS17DRAFT_109116 [Gyrodon lividus]